MKTTRNHRSLNQAIKLICLMAVFAGMFVMNCSGPDNEKELESGFKDPPESAKPRVWWHWMNGNVTTEGIKADLEWMKRIGIGGFQNFDAGLATPQVVEKRLIFMTPEWKEAFRITTKLADSLGLEMAIAGSPGWSESGGPWVKPEQAMKKLVWSDTVAEGGKSFSAILPHPPTETGIFQNITELGGYMSGETTGSSVPKFYADAAVVAFRFPEKDISLMELKPNVTSSSGRFELSALTDGDLSNAAFLHAGKNNEKAWIQFDFTKPQTIYSLTLVKRETGMRLRGIFGSPRVSRALEISDDGKLFRSVLDIPDGGTSQNTYTFTPETARYYRITFIMPPAPEVQVNSDLAAMFGINSRQPVPEPGINISELVLHPVARINRFEDKAGFTAAAGLYKFATSPVAAEDAVNKNDIIDLTGKMDSDGKVEWTPPSGRWKIIRFGYTLTGHQNSPASPEATGLEVDKLSASHVKAYFENYLDQYKDATGGLMGKRGLQYLITDSWEAGVQNWTDSMPAEFARRRGYDIIRWMPVLAGHIVESSEASERFLWDFRKTIGELTAEKHYDQLTEILKDRGMGRYTESHESGRAFIGDGMEVKRKSDIPMSATWTPGGFAGQESEGVATRYKADVRESASVSHLYGQNLVAAESMTAIGNTWAFSPERLKPTADMELAMGLNRFVIHTSVHQPVNDKIPGLGLGPFGQWFTRHETWAEQAKPWTTYLARNSYMLQQGRFVADIVYYYGEDNNITALYGEKLPDVPEGYNYDFINSDALVNLLSVREGLLVTPSGMSYRLLALDPNSQHMTMRVLQKIRDLAEAGAAVAGPRPLESPSLSDDQDKFRELVNELWPTEKGQKKVGKGTIFSGFTISEALTALNTLPDFEYTKPDPGTSILYVHRRMPGVDIYWINNRQDQLKKVEGTFRVEGKRAEIWNPETGTIEKASFSISEGQTTVPLTLQPNDAIFVVFRKKSTVNSFVIPETVEKQISEFKGPWTISFQPGRGAPEKLTIDTLRSWTDIPDPGVKFFSGTGTYSKSIELKEGAVNAGERIIIDLGTVKNLAEVIINGQSAGIIWKKPFRVDITDFLKPGENMLEIKVTNLWVNRLIGDQQPGTEKKYTYTTMAFYQADSPLLPSGLIGPVSLISISE